MTNCTVSVPSTIQTLYFRRTWPASCPYPTPGASSASATRAHVGRGSFLIKNSRSTDIKLSAALPRCSPLIDSSSPASTPSSRPMKYHLARALRISLLTVPKSFIVRDVPGGCESGDGFLPGPESLTCHKVVTKLSIFVGTITQKWRSVSLINSAGLPLSDTVFAMDRLVPCIPPLISLSTLLLQWNPSKEDTIGTKDFVLYREVSLTQG